jgi:hypothetical protein
MTTRACIARAEDVCRSALEPTQKSPGPSDPPVTTTLHYLAALRGAEAGFATDEAGFRRGLSILEPAPSPACPGCML